MILAVAQRHRNKETVETNRVVGKLTNNPGIKTGTTKDLREWGFSVTDKMS